MEFSKLEYQGHSSSCGGLKVGHCAPITIQSMDDLGRLQGRYPENIVFISQLEVCQEVGSRRGYLEDVGGS